jgi:uncharacterized transporter YbjL
MDITNTANVAAVQSTGSTSNNVTTSSAQSGASSSSPYSSRLLSRITASNSLSGIEKNGLIETVSLIDKLKSGDTLRSKLLKDVAAVTEYLEKTSVVRNAPVKVQQPVVQVEKIIERVAHEVEQQKPSDEKIVASITEKLQSIANEAKVKVDKAENTVEITPP